jgi:hypothetical protein
LGNTPAKIKASRVDARPIAEKRRCITLRQLGDQRREDRLRHGEHDHHDDTASDAKRDALDEPPGISRPSAEEPRPRRARRSFMITIAAYGSSPG